MADRWTLRLGFDALNEVVDAWSLAVGEGGFWVKSEAPPQAEELDLVLVAGLNALEPMHAQVVNQAPRPNERGFWIQPEPSTQILQMVGDVCGAPAWAAVNRKVLVIDDEPIWRSALARVLKGLGCTVHLASDGLDGMRKVTDLLLELDLVVVDLHLPYFDGREVLETVREAGREGELKLMLFSGASAEELDAIRATGYSNAVMSKLDPLDQVAERIKQLLGMPHHAKAA